MFLILILVVLALLVPLSAWAQTKGPLDYSLKQYGFILGISLLGGVVSWSHKVRKGDAQAWNVMQLIGELATSAFAGLLAFWLCELSVAAGRCAGGYRRPHGHARHYRLRDLRAAPLGRWSGPQPARRRAAGRR